MRWLGLRRKQFKDPTKKDNNLNALNAEVAQNNSKTPPKKIIIAFNAGVVEDSEEHKNAAKPEVVETLETQPPPKKMK